MDVIFCSECGTAIPATSKFCQRCGARVVDSTMTAAPEKSEPTARSAAAPAGERSDLRNWSWLGVPLAIVLIIGILVVILMVLPFGRPAGAVMDEGLAPVEQVSEVPPGAPSTVTIVDVDPPPVVTELNGSPAPRPDSPWATGGPAEPSVAPTPAPQPVPAAPQPQPVAPPQPVEPAPPSPVAQIPEVSESQAVSILRSYVTSRNYYDVAPGCVSVQSRGHRNQGYDLDVIDQCSQSLLGRWRVDEERGEVFRQRPDGRYLRP